jgi:hypothetical protein
VGNIAWYARIRGFRPLSAEFPLHGVPRSSGTLPAGFPRGPPTYIQRRAIRYRPQTTIRATIFQSTATNQKGMAVRSPSPRFAFGFESHSYPGGGRL